MGGLAPQRSFDPAAADVPLGPAQNARPGLVEARRGEGARQLERTARMLAPLGAPVIVFNASHSGSRLLALMLKRLGVFMGSNLNESEDSLDLFELVRYIVERHAPDYSGLFASRRRGVAVPRGGGVRTRTWRTGRPANAGAGSCRRPATCCR